MDEKKEVNHYKVLEKLYHMINCQIENNKSIISKLDPKWDAYQIADRESANVEMQEEVDALVYAMNLISG